MILFQLFQRKRPSLMMSLQLIYLRVVEGAGSLSLSHFHSVTAWPFALMFSTGLGLSSWTYIVNLFDSYFWAKLFCFSLLICSSSSCSEVETLYVTSVWAGRHDSSSLLRRVTRYFYHRFTLFCSRMRERARACKSVKYVFMPSPLLSFPIDEKAQPMSRFPLSFLQL